MKLIPKLRRCLKQEAAQSLRVGEARQTGQVLESAVRTQERRGLQAIQAKHNGVYKSEHHLGNGVSAVTPGISNMSSKKIAQLQHSEKFMEEIGAPKVRQPTMITGDFEVSGRSSHPEPYLTKSEVRLSLAKTTRTLNKQSHLRITEALECAGFRYQGPTFSPGRKGPTKPRALQAAEKGRIGSESRSLSG